MTDAEKYTMRQRQAHAQRLGKYRDASLEPEMPSRQARLRAARKNQHPEGNSWGYFGAAHTEKVPEIAEYEENGHKITVYRPVIARGAYPSEFDGWGV